MGLRLTALLIRRKDRRALGTYDTMRKLSTKTKIYFTSFHYTTILNQYNIFCRLLKIPTARKLIISLLEQGFRIYCLITPGSHFLTLNMSFRLLIQISIVPLRAPVRKCAHHLPTCDEFTTSGTRLSPELKWHVDESA